MQRVLARGARGGGRTGRSTVSGRRCLQGIRSARARTHARRTLQEACAPDARMHALIHAHTHTRAHASTHADLQEGVGLTAHRNCRRVWRVQRLQGPAYPSQRLHGGRPRRCHGWNACEFARLFVRLFPCKPCKGLSKCRDRSGSATDPAPPFHCPPPRARQAPRTGSRIPIRRGVRAPRAASRCLQTSGDIHTSGHQSGAACSRGWGRRTPARNVVRAKRPSAQHRQTVLR